MFLRSLRVLESYVKFTDIYFYVYWQHALSALISTRYICKDIFYFVDTNNIFFIFFALLFFIYSVIIMLYNLLLYCYI